jgi:prepilin-type processing-associated H-X9-DG protein
MSETETQEGAPKPRTSELARASLIISIVAPCLWFVSSVVFVYKVPFWLVPCIMAVILSWLSVPFLAIAALVEINRSSRLLQGRGFAIAGLCLWLVPIAIGCLLNLFSQHPRDLAPRVVCGTNMRGLVKAMVVYANDYDAGRFPQADKWCDVLIQADFTTYKQLVCRGSDAIAGECSYAMNRNVAGKNMLALPPGMVLLFETKAGWNQVGGPEILTTENHKGEGCNVAFVDTHVEFVSTRDLGKLKWKVEQDKDE